MLAEVAQRDARGRPPATRARVASDSSDLAAVGRGRDPGRAMDVEPDVVAVAVEVGLAGVEAHPDAELAPSGHGSAASARWASTAAATAAPARREHHEERVALGVLTSWPPSPRTRPG